MFLKLLASGFYEYIKSGFNAFDGCIVIVTTGRTWQRTECTSNIPFAENFETGPFYASTTTPTDHNVADHRQCCSV
ncbi:hypothetical protein QR98_0087450, partial [Sarcoptes scabiei]